METRQQELVITYVFMLSLKFINNISTIEKLYPKSFASSSGSAVSSV